MTPNANQAPTTIAPIRPIKFRNGRPIEVFSEIFTDMIGTHLNQNLIQLMPPLYNPDYRIDLAHLLVETLFHTFDTYSSLFTFFLFEYYTINLVKDRIYSPKKTVHPSIKHYIPCSLGSLDVMFFSALGLAIESLLLFLN